MAARLLGGISNAVTTLATGQPTDPNAIRQARMDATYRALMDSGVPEPQARAAALNSMIPNMARPAPRPAPQASAADNGAPPTEPAAPIMPTPARPKPRYAVPAVPPIPPFGGPNDAATFAQRWDALRRSAYPPLPPGYTMVR